MSDQPRQPDLSKVSPRRRLRSLAGDDAFHLSYDLMRDHVIGHLDPPDAEIVASHIEECGMCRAELADLKSFDAALHPVSSRVSERVPAKIRFIDRFLNSLGRHQWRWAASAAALVLIFSAGPALLRYSGGRPSGGWETGADATGSGRITESAAKSGSGPQLPWERASSRQEISDNTGSALSGLPPGATLADGSLRLGLDAQGMITGLPADTPFMLHEHLRRVLTDGTFPAPEALRTPPRVMGGDPLPLYDLAAVRRTLPGSRLAAALVHWREGNAPAAREELEALAVGNADSAVVRQLLEQVR